MIYYNKKMAIILFLMSIVSEIFAVYTLLKLNVLSFLPNDVLLNDLFIPIVTDISLVVPIVSIALYYWLNARKNKFGELNRKSYFSFFLIVLLIIIPISLFINFNKIVLWEAAEKVDKNKVVIPTDVQSVNGSLLFL